MSDCLFVLRKPYSRRICSTSAYVTDFDDVGDRSSFRNLALCSMIVGLVNLLPPTLADLMTSLPPQPIRIITKA